MKKKLYYWVKKYVTTDNVHVFVLLIPLCIIFVQKIKKGALSLESFLDIDILVSFILVTLCGLIAKDIVQFVEKKCEDSVKLRQDYDELVNKYNLENMITYQGNIFPVSCLFIKQYNQNIEIEVKDCPDKFYHLPKQVENYSEELMEVHNQSVLYNQINIRLDHVIVKDAKLILHTSRTFYFDSMITNRACDYKISNCKSIREIYEPGPYMQPLHCSKLSNHLGFNGFVMTTDKKIPFIMRGNNLSIGKNTLANSIGASLKTSYALHKENNFQMTGVSLGQAIVHEIEEELGLELPNLTGVEALNSIIAVYRDFVECGKPQFLFYLKLKDIDSELLSRKFEKKIAEQKGKNKDKVICDGEELYFFTLEELKNAKVSADTLCITADRQENNFTMMPSASACIVMLLEYLNIKDINL